MAARTTASALSQPPAGDASGHSDVVADRALLDRMIDGDSAAVESLYLRYFERLVRFAHAYVRSRAIAEEIVQETFLVLWEQRQSLRVRENIKVYLYGAVRNRALHHTEHARVEERTEQWAAHDGVALGMATRDVRPDTKVEQDELSSAVARAILALPERRRIALMLRWRHELSYAEIADIMESTVPAVTIQVARAREFIAAFILQYTDER